MTYLYADGSDPGEEKLRMQKKKKEKKLQDEFLVQAKRTGSSPHLEVVELGAGGNRKKSKMYRHGGRGFLGLVVGDSEVLSCLLLSSLNLTFHF